MPGQENYTELEHFMIAMGAEVGVGRERASFDLTVAYALGHLEPDRARAIEAQAMTDHLLRARLLSTCRVVDRLQREGAPSLDRAEGTPLEAEITHAWKRGLSASTTFADSPDSLDMIGRERELAELRRLLTAGKTRLFTVTGPSGIGKSCLLRRLRREVESQFRDGSKLVGCGAIESAEDFCRAIGGPALPSSSLSALIEGLGNSHLLLMLDGADALSAHTPLLEAILAGCPNVRIVSSSRGPLGASGEHVFPLAPLQIDAEAAGSSDALKLFANAAAAADRKFELTGRTLHLAQEICRRTMGVPLALIIAAGCLAELSLSDVSRDLGQIPAKQTQVTAFNAVEGTLRLLSHTDVRMVRLLHVFAGLFSFEEARLVIGATDDDVSEFLHRMRNCGLLAKYEDEEGIAYQLHDAALEHSVSQADATSSIDEYLAASRHAVVMSTRAEALGEAMSQGRWQRGTQELLRSNEDFRRALNHSIAYDDRERVRVFADSLSRSYFEAGFLTDFRNLAHAGHSLDEPAVASRLLGLQGALASREGDEATCTRLWMRRLELCRAEGDIAGCADVLTDLAWQAYELNDVEAAFRLLDEGDELLLKTPDPALSATLQIIRARIFIKTSEPEMGREWVAKAHATMEKARAEGANPDLLLFVSQNIVLARKDLGESDSLRPAVLAHLSTAFQGRRAIHTGWALMELADIAERSGDFEAAATALAAAIGVYREYQTKHRRKAEERIERFAGEHGERITDVLRELRSTPWETLVDRILRARVA